MQGWDSILPDTHSGLTGYGILCKMCAGKESGTRKTESIKNIFIATI